MTNPPRTATCTTPHHSDDTQERQQTENNLQSRNQDLELLSKSQDETKRAMLNVMEDLESAKSVIELEKAKDEAMLASIGEGLVAVDNNRRIMVMNTAAEDLLGYKIKDMLGHEITDVRLEDEHGDLIPLKKRPTYAALASGKPIHTTCYLVRKDKTSFPVAITVTPIKLNGKIIGAVDIVRDITHEKEIDKAKSEFVSLASHQLRTPLGIIKWYVEALENEDYIKNSPPTIQKYFKEIYKSNERILCLVRDLLSVSRIEQGQVKNDPKLVNLIPIVEEIVAQMLILAQKKNVTLNVHISSRQLPDITIDVLRFHEVIENLISNAIEYTLASGKIDVTIDQINDKLVISVKDTGIGISAADQKKLFTKFFRSENSIKHNPEGSGLGLYIAKSYVEGWGGKITAESSEGKGSTFTMSLPITKPSAKGGVDEKNLNRRR